MISNTWFTINKQNTVFSLLGHLVLLLSHGVQHGHSQYPVFLLMCVYETTRLEWPATNLTMMKLPSYHVLKNYKPSLVYCTKNHELRPISTVRTNSFDDGKRLT